MRKPLYILLVLGVGAAVIAARQGTAVVTNGRFTNIYFFPNPSAQTWEQHIKSLRPSDFAQFSRANIDAFTQRITRPGWPSYFSWLFQYSQINPPQFFGSAVASQACVDAAMKDRKDGVLHWESVRSLSNCHISGHDPSPQMNIIFSPDIRLGTVPSTGLGAGPEMCTSATNTNAYHAWGVNTPNFTVLPTNTTCTPSFGVLTKSMTHEMVELLSDPAGFGVGDLGSNEIGDDCENSPDRFGAWVNDSISRYWSTSDNECVPQIGPPAGSVAMTWELGQGSPLKRFKGDDHTLTLSAPSSRSGNTTTVTEAVIVIQTGDDDLRGGSNASDNADVTLNLAAGGTLTANINHGHHWDNGQTHSAKLNLPSAAPRVSDITGVTLTTHFGGGTGGDNWNVNKVALVVSSSGRGVRPGPPPPPPATVTHRWLDASSNPLVRFTGDVHEKRIPVPAMDVGKNVTALTLIISTGNDDLRGGSNPGDNCNVTVQLASGSVITLNNVNNGHGWANWTNNNVSIPIPGAGLKGGDVKSVTLSTHFGGGMGGDNWNVNRVQLEATVAN